MALVEFNKIKQLFSSAASAEDEHQAYRELFVLVLSRATDADAYTHPAEIESVQRVIKEYLGEEISVADVRTAALSKLYESAPFEKYLIQVGPKLKLDERRAIIRGLVDVFNADDRVSSKESDFFNRVVSAFGLTAADAAGLYSD
jgi:uncharacterized tellurite resistance protein B-like protein